MREYDEIIPGAAERILALAEIQTHHRIELESKALISGIRRSWGGLFVAAAISTQCLGLAGYMAYLGQPIEGLAAMTAGLGSLVYVFVRGTKKRSEERERKNAKMKRH